MLPNYEDKIIYHLVKKGYTVGADIAKTDVNQHNYLSHLIAITVYQMSRPAITAQQVCADLATVMGEMQFLFYSMVVSLVEDAAWAGSNIVVSPTKNLPSSPTPGDDKSQLN